MKTNVFVSFSFENENIDFVNKIISELKSGGNAVDYSEKEDRTEYSNETIWKNLLARIHGSSVTIVALTPDLLGENRRKISSGNGFNESGWVYKEISASLRDWKNNKINGVLVIYDDSRMRKPNKIAKIINYNRDNKKSYRNNDHTDNYIDIISFSEFSSNPKHYIQRAKDKRDQSDLYNIKYDFHN